MSSKETSSQNVHVINLSTYTRPKVIEAGKKEWVEYGGDNNYYQYLIDCYIGSTSNHSIINGVAEMIYGEGIEATDAKEKPEQFVRFKEILSDDCLRKSILDLKLLGEASFQVVYNVEGELSALEHFPRHTLRAEKCNEKGEVEAYYYHRKWVDKKRNEEDVRIPVFGKGDGESEILIIRKYVAGYEYYTPVDYPGGLAYAELEEQIADYLINDVQNGFSGTKVINFNNGVPDKNKREEINNDVINKLTGARGTKVIVGFNKSIETQTTVEDIPLNDAPAHYEYLSSECFKKLIVAHRITSPMLLGMRDGNDSLGNNANEIEVATILFNKIVIRPYQNLLISGINKVLIKAGINLDLYFKTLMPIEFLDESTDIEDVAEKEKETGIKMSEEPLEDELFLGHLEGEIVDEDWELVDDRELGIEDETAEEWANRCIKPLEEFSIKSKKSGFSYLDKSFYKIRYRYAERHSTGSSRRFCQVMMRRAQSGVVYRVEDIDKASREGVNRSFGHNGRPYDLFKYKGGPNCSHYWTESLYRLKKKTDGSWYKKTASTASYDEVDSIPKSYKPTPAGHRKAKVAPKDMANNGHHPKY